MSSTFLKNITVWVLFMPIIIVILLPLMFDKSDFRFSSSEIDRNVQIVGAKFNAEAVDATKRIYLKSLKPTICQASLLETEKSANDDFFVKMMKDVGFNKSNGARCQQLARGIYRFDIELKFMACVFLIAFAAAFDGLTVRATDKFEFGYQSPLKFHIATHAFIAAIGLMFAAPFLPIAFTAVAWPAITVIIALIAWIAARNYQAGI